MLFKSGNENLEYFVGKELNYDDLVIINYIGVAVQMANISNCYIDGNGVYTIIKLEKMLDELPLVCNSTATLTRKILSLCEKGVLEKVVKCVDNTPVKRTYYRVSTATLLSMYYNTVTFGKGELLLQTQANSESNDKENVNQALQNQVENIKKETEIIKQVIDYLNKKLGTRYTYRNNNSNRHIKARIAEGKTFEDFKQVIDTKYAEWKLTEMEKYLRPETLFGTKFESYQNQTDSKKDKFNYNKKCDY